MDQKYYAVKKGLQNGVYTSAEKTLQNIDDCPDAWVKAFDNEQEAHDFVFDSASHTDSNHVIAYVDGSYNKDTGQYSSGIVMIAEGKVILEKGEAYATMDYRESHQIAGEVFGAARAIQHAIIRGFEKITIYYDFLGIEKWATKEWKTNKPVSQNYATFIDKVKSQIDIQFEKVKAHSGDYYNERADQLAKNALN